MDESQGTQTMAAALTAHGVAFSPSESESAHLGIAYVAPAATTPAVPAAPAAPAKAPTLDEQIAAINAPITGQDGKTDALFAEAMAPLATPDAYELPGITAGQQHTPEQTALLTEARTALHGAGLAAPIAKAIAERINDGLGKPPNDIQRAHANAAGTTQLRQAWGADFDANLKAVRGEVRRLAEKSPNLIAWLETSGSGNDPFVVRSLFNSMYARRAA